MVLGVKYLKINKLEFKRRFGVKIKDIFNKKIEKLKKWNLMTETKSTFSLTAKGETLCGQHFEDFLYPKEQKTPSASRNEFRGKFREETKFYRQKWI